MGNVRTVIANRARDAFRLRRTGVVTGGKKRHFEELGPALLQLKKSTRELPDGYEFELPADNRTYQLLTEWAFQERLCCPFLDIGLRFDRESGPLWLRLTGRPGTKQFIKEEFEVANSR